MKLIAHFFARVAMLFVAGLVLGLAFVIFRG